MRLDLCQGAEAQKRKVRILSLWLSESKRNRDVMNFDQSCNGDAKEMTETAEFRL